MAKFKFARYSNPRKTPNWRHFSSHRFLVLEFFVTLPSSYSAILVFISLILATVPAHAQLIPAEIQALNTILDNFPALARVPPSARDYFGNYIGKSWSRDFSTLCQGSNGYEYFGVDCADFHIGGLYITEEWGIDLSRNYSGFPGLFSFVNLSITSANGVDLARALSKGIVTNVFDPYGHLNSSDYTWPAYVRSIWGTSATFDISRLTNLKFLIANGSIGTNMYTSWVWPYQTLQHLEFTRSSIFSLNLDWLAVHLSNFSSLQYLSFPCDSFSSRIDLTASNSLKSLKMDFVSNILASVSLNATNLEDITLSGDFLAFNLTTPNLVSLTLRSTRAFPTFATSVPHMEIWDIGGIGVSLPVVQFPDLAPTLKHLYLSDLSADSSSLSNVLCPFPQSIVSLSIDAMWDHQVAANLIQVPSCLKSSPSLVEISLKNTRCESVSISNLPSGLTHVQWENAMATAYSLPSFLAFTNLASLTIIDPMLTGEIPASFFSNLPNLLEFEVNSTSLLGTIPPTGWSNLRKVTLVGGFENWLNIDAGLNLQYLSVISNRLSSIPEESSWSALQSLVHVQVESGPIYGRLPHFWNFLDNIETVIFSGGAFEGTIPSKLIPTTLKNLDLSSNLLCGLVPNVNYPLTLKSLDLSRNKLNGTIRSSWGSFLTVTDKLDLSHNWLSGTIPRTLMERSIVSTFFINNNWFNGSLWNMSRGIPFNFDVDNTGIDLCGINPSILGPYPVCKFNNVSRCSIDCSSIWPCATHSPCNEIVLSLPPSIECITPPERVNYQCAPPPPAGFDCRAGQWVSPGSVNYTSVSLPANGGVIVVNGNFSINGTLSFEGSGTSLQVKGCFERAPTEIVLTLTQELPGPITLLSQNSNCTLDLRNTPVVLTGNSNGCRVTTVSTSTSTPSSLYVIFSLDLSQCKSPNNNTKWIIVGSVVGGVLFIVVLSVVLLSIFRPEYIRHFRTMKFRTQPSESSKTYPNAV